jgi:hypothetical protein
MGCDIWAFVEYETINWGFTAFFNGPIIYLPRNYLIFAALAGVRNRDEKPPLYEARGLPENLSPATFEGYYQFVIDKKDAELFNGFNHVFIDALGEAEKSRLIPPEQGSSWIKPKYGYISSSDFHTPSWLKLSEVINALEYHGIDLNEMPSEYQVMLDVMSSIRKRGLSNTPRLVFWFSG